MSWLPLRRWRTNYELFSVLLTLVRLWTNSADDKLMIFFLFFQENRILHFMQIVSSSAEIFTQHAKFSCENYWPASFSDDHFCSKFMEFIPQIFCFQSALYVQQFFTTGRRRRRADDICVFYIYFFNFRWESGSIPSPRTWQIFTVWLWGSLRGKWRCSFHKPLWRINLDSMYITSNYTNRNVRNRTFRHVRPAKIQIRLHSLIRIFTGRIFDSQGGKISSCGLWRLWSDCADAQADLSLRWAYMSDSTFSDVTAHKITVYGSCRLQKSIIHCVDWLQSLVTFLIL